MSEGFSGQEGQKVPEMTPEVVAGITARYVELYEHLTGEKFIPAESGDALSRIEANINAFLSKNEAI